MSESFLVSIYHVDMAYGGSEEGGWWYDRGSIVRTVKTFKNEDLACAYCRKLNAKLDGLVNKHFRPKSSVISDGVYEAHIHENHAPKGFPETRPYYE